ncbi:MAG: hypothetical protein DHS20C16_06230 [Phycisphaerae bacterium]|nr:MAG: hypothetical protein DHS20C16_06230 [Phycisphaerae bacterium]
MPENTQWRVVVAGTVALAVIWMLLRVRKWLKRRSTPKIHPRLQKYQPSQDDFAAKRREESAKIIATSSGESLVGYRIVRQVEAVFVDGFRRPEEAVEGLKAVAAMKGANAVLCVRHEPIGSGRYSASGDAVIVESIEPESPPPTVEQTDAGIDVTEEDSDDGVA